nr:reverse transcriptase domain-containing protein [Tanacetum cinerariifolium]
MHVKGSPECMRIFGFMHGITNPKIIKRLHDHILKSVDEMMRATITFLKGEVAASNQAQKKTPPTWKQQEVGRKPSFERKEEFRNQRRSERRRDKFTLLIKSPREILALDKGKFKAPPPMTAPVEKRNSNKFCEFHGKVGNTTDEYMHLKRQIKEMIKAGKLSHALSESKKINGSSHSTPRWFQWRDHMADGVNITPSKDRKARFKENPSGPIHGSWDVKIPSSRGITNSTEQQDNPTRMRNGLRTKSTTFRSHSSTRRKNQSGYHPEYPEQMITIGSTLTEED